MRIGNVMAGARKKALLLLLRQLAHYLGRAPEDHAPIRKFFAFSHQCTGTHQAAFSDAGTIQNNRTDTDQRAVANRAAMQHHLMSNRHVVADDERFSDICVQNARVLYVAACTYGDAFGIPAHHRTEPYAGIRADFNCADHFRTLCDPGTAMHHRGHAI